MALSAELLAHGVGALALGLDGLVGDPRPWPHPVVLMGWWIARLRKLAEAWAGDRPWALRLAGGLITLVLVTGSVLAGWGVERLALAPPAAGLGQVLLVVGLASALAGRSLSQAVETVLAALPSDPGASGALLEPARQQLSWIVGRDTAGLHRAEILRALGETASENGVDGLFAPLFWLLVGAALWGAGWWIAPGPLALAWGFKAASTLDSMLGYRRGRLQWLGSAGARLDDVLVWLPCRLVLLSLPGAAGVAPGHWPALVRRALRDGRADPSPNAGVSQAIYAHVVGVRLGGPNRYAGQLRAKPLLAAGCPPPDAAAVRRMLRCNARLSWLWVAAATLPAAWLFVTKPLS
jgi:adenosylcobinamide-phosphate synthase